LFGEPCRSQNLPAWSRSRPSSFFHQTNPRTTIYRAVACSYFSSLVYLIVNNLTSPEHTNAEVDEALVDNALEILHLLVVESGNHLLEAMHAACLELSVKAKICIGRHRQEQADLAAIEQTLLDSLPPSTTLPVDVGDLDPASALVWEYELPQHPGFGNKGDDRDVDSLIRQRPLDFVDDGVGQVHTWEDWLENRRHVSAAKHDRAEVAGTGEQTKLDRLISEFLAGKRWF
jgi:hypothetical protein